VTATSSTRAYSFFMVFFILTLAFSLTSAGILNANITIGMAAYAKKSKGSSDGSSGGGSGGSGGLLVSWHLLADLSFHLLAS
jgi:hypothetical protein